MTPTSDPFAIRAGMTAGEACGAILDREAHAFAAGLAETMLSDDPEGPHRARVALRRLRSALWAFAPILKDAKCTSLTQRAKTLFRRLGHLRDADVLVASHVGPRLERVQLLDEAAKIRAETRRHLRDDRALGFAATVEALVRSGKAMDRGHRARERARDPAEALAAEALDRSWTACVADGANLLAMPDPVLHDLRKRIKRMRYLVDFFGPLWPDTARDLWSDDLRAMQDSLGRYCDLRLAAERGVATGDPDEAAEATAGAAAIWSKFRARPPFWRAVVETAVP